MLTQPRQTCLVATNWTGNALEGVTRIEQQNPQAWLADVLARISEHPFYRLDKLLAWNWAIEMECRKLAA
jgi:hypothetical protein